LDLWLRQIQTVTIFTQLQAYCSNCNLGIKKFIIPGSWDPVSGLGLQIGHYFGIPNEHNYA